MVIISVREEQKQMTKQKIIAKTTELLQENGFIRVSTKDIANVCGVSQGTIFLHFGTKQHLLYSILNSNVSEFRDDFIERCKAEIDQEIFLKEYLYVLAKHENILSRVYKDYFYLSEDLQKEVNDLETLIKNEIFDNLKTHWSKSINILDTFVLIDAFLAQVRAYLLEKNSSSVQSIIKQRRGRIIKLYNRLF